MIAYFDSGTTNSRLYLLNHAFETVYAARRAVGSKDSAISGSNEGLLATLKEMYDEGLATLGLSDGDVSDIYASGMVTSPFGIHEVPHLLMPLGPNTCKELLYAHQEDRYFHRRIQLVRGLKTADETQLEDFSSLSNMRGEEIEALGLMSDMPAAWLSEGVALVLPGSHTHTLYIKGGQIADALSNLWGELYHALTSATVLHAAKVGDEPFEQEGLLAGWHALRTHGFNRAAYLCHAMGIFQREAHSYRASFLEGVVAGGVVQSLMERLGAGWSACGRIIVASERQAFDIFAPLLREALPSLPVEYIELDTQRSFAVKGLAHLLSMDRQ